MFNRKKTTNQPNPLENDVVLRIENLSKKFCRTLKRSIFYGTVDIARSMIGLECKTWELRKDEFWALDNISFDLHRGESLGIIGVNGSGKSTLLRLITGIFPPDKGRIYHKGRVGALIAVGAGFHPHMTGRENIYLNGTILGMTRKEIDNKLDEIINFADIGDFLDAPVNTYSSGMRVRLGFSIAVHCEPDILLVDEILSVGDLSFRNKSMRKMAEFRDKASALIYISHNLEQIRNLCSRTIVIDMGKIVFMGDTHEALSYYEEHSRKKRTQKYNETEFRFIESDSQNVAMLKFGILDSNDLEVDRIGLHEPLIAFIDFEVKQYIEEIKINFAIRGEENTNIIWVNNTDFQKSRITDINPGLYRQKLAIYHHHLNVGVYSLSFALGNAATFENFIKAHSQKFFFISNDGKKLERGVINTQEDWLPLSDLPVNQMALRK